MIYFVLPFSGSDSGGSRVVRELHAKAVERASSKIIVVPPYLKVRGVKRLFRMMRFILFFSSPKRTFQFFDFLMARGSSANKFVFSWTEDYQWLAHLPSSQIFHLMQSDDIWGADAQLVYDCGRADLNRISVAHHLLDDATRGNVDVLDLVEIIDKENPKNIKKNTAVTYLADAWFKGGQINDYFAKKLAKELSFQYISFGSLPSKLADISFPFLSKPDLLKLLSEARIFISLSRHEGMPLLVLEAIYKNAFCVLSDIPAHREISDLYPDRVHIVERHRSLRESAEKIKSALNNLNPDAEIISCEVGSRISFSEAISTILEVRHIHVKKAPPNSNS